MEATQNERLKKGLTSSFRLLTRSTPLPECPDRATRPAAAAAAAAALRGLRAPVDTHRAQRSTANSNTAPSKTLQLFYKQNVHGILHESFSNKIK